jgi:hypothetical protein
VKRKATSAAGAVTTAADMLFTAEAVPALQSVSNSLRPQSNEHSYTAETLSHQQVRVQPIVGSLPVGHIAMLL